MYIIYIVVKLKNAKNKWSLNQLEKKDIKYREKQCIKTWVAYQNDKEKEYNE